MAFKVTFIDGQEDDYGDDTEWVVEDAVLKMGPSATRPEPTPCVDLNRC
jgi:hypothetical protein